MNKKEMLATATFVVFYTGFIFAVCGWMLSAKIEPIKAEIAPIKTEIALIKAEIAPIKAEIALIKENQIHLEKRMDRLETRMGLEMKEIKSMLGQILVAQNTHHKGKTKPAGKAKKTIKIKPANRDTASH